MYKPRIIIKYLIVAKGFFIRFIRMNLGPLAYAGIAPSFPLRNRDDQLPQHRRARNDRIEIEILFHRVVRLAADRSQSVKRRRSQPGGQQLTNPDFEQGTMNGWSWQGGGWAGVETCCGQHNTAFWGTGTNPYLPYYPGIYTANTWDAGMDLPGGWMQIYQYRQVNQGQKYRMSSWVFTSGVTGSIRRYGTTTGYAECGSTANTAHTPISCEFTASANEDMAFILEATGASGQWAVSDDWTLTQIVTVPRNLLADLWSAFPVYYYIDSSAYPTRTDIAAWSWNTAMGRTMLQRTSNSGLQGGIKVIAKSDTNDLNAGSTVVRKDSQGNMIVTLNRFWMDPWTSSNYRYGFEMREGVIAHEFGHTLALEHVQNECQLQKPGATVHAWNCSAFKPTSGDVDGVRAIYP